MADTNMGNFLATDRVPDTIFGIPVVSKREDYTEADLEFFREHPEAGGYYDMGEGTPEDGSEEGAPVQEDEPPAEPGIAERIAKAAVRKAMRFADGHRRTSGSGPDASVWQKTKDFTRNAGAYVADRAVAAANKFTPLPANVATAMRSFVAKNLAVPGADGSIPYTPVPIDESFFSDDEQLALWDMFVASGGGEKGVGISTEGIKKVKKDHRYGGLEQSLIDRMRDAASVVETTIGQAGVEYNERGVPAYLTDTYDFNVKSDKSKRDNKMYEMASKTNEYAHARAEAPRYLQTEDDPNASKIKIRINLRNLAENVRRIRAERSRKGKGAK